MFVIREPAPECTASSIDDVTRREIIGEAYRGWYERHERHFTDYSAVVADLPTLRAEWETRTSVVYGGVVPVFLDVHADGWLQISLMEARYGVTVAGRYTQFRILDRSERGPTGSFDPLWVHPKTERSVGPVHAAISVRPDETGTDLDRTRVVIYNPPHRPDILLVATKTYRFDEWTPLLRIDLPKATRFSVYGRGDPH